MSALLRKRLFAQHDCGTGFGRVAEFRTFETTRRPLRVQRPSCRVHRPAAYPCMPRALALGYGLITLVLPAAPRPAILDRLAALAGWPVLAMGIEYALLIFSGAEVAAFSLAKTQLD
jgi:hypothetical protein